jgi:hypothetical protein
MVNRQTTFINCRLFCVMLDTPRWRNYKKTPIIGSLLQITAEIIGMYEIRTKPHLCVAIMDISFLPQSSTTSTRPVSATISPTETPRKRLRKRGEPSLEQTPTKRLRQDTPTHESSRTSQNVAHLENEDGTSSSSLSSPYTTPVKKEEE